MKSVWVQLNDRHGQEFLRRIARAGPRFVKKELTFIGQLFHRELVKHIPVDKTQYKQNTSIQVSEEPGGLIEVGIGTNVKASDGFNYPAALEFGWGNIAGGAVADWKEGDPPIIDWPAKRAEAIDRTVVARDSRGRGLNARGKRVSKVDDNSAEFMPPMRGTWQLISDQVTARLRKRFHELLQKELI